MKGAGGGGGGPGVEFAGAGKLDVFDAGEPKTKSEGVCCRDAGCVSGVCSRTTGCVAGVG